MEVRVEGRTLHPDRLRARRFAHIYRTNGFRGRGTRSGPGSTMGATDIIRRVLPELVDGLGITSVLDAPCGDSWWMPDIAGYIGVDIVPEAVQAARERHPDRDYRVLDVCTDVLPKVELVFCRDLIQHLPLADGLLAIENFRRTGATWLVCSTHEDGTNTDIVAGDSYTPDMQAFPFALGTPWMVIEDGLWDTGNRWPDKYLGVWLCGQ